MSPTTAFLAITAFLVLASTFGYVLSRRRGKWWFAVATGAGFLGVGVHLTCVWRPDAVAPLIAGTDLALLYPGLSYAFGVVLLFALGPRAGARNHRAVVLLGGFIAALVLWNASGLLGDPALQLEEEARWKGDCCLQSTPWSCAPAAACSLLRMLGVDARESEMARLMRSRPHFGTDLLNMHRGLSRKLEGTGYRVELRRLDYEGLVAAAAPGLASIKLHLLLDHAVAVCKADLEGVTVQDPLHGPLRILRSTFGEIWKREVLLVLPVSEK